jgi:FkbM family methyltransferase
LDEQWLMLRIKRNQSPASQLLVEAEHKSELPLISEVLERYLKTRGHGKAELFFVHAKRNIGYVIQRDATKVKKYATLLFSAPGPMLMLDAIAKFINERVLHAFDAVLLRKATVSDLTNQIQKLKEQKGNLESLSASLDQQLHKKGLDPIGTWVIAEVSTGVRMWLDLGDLFISRYCLQGGFEADETRFVQNFLEADFCFIDVGANIGWFTLLAARLVGEKGRVIAFEPRPDLFARLAMSATENSFNQIEAHQVALGQETGKMPIACKVAAANPGGTWSIPNERLRATIDETYEQFEVDVCRLDDFDIDRCDLLKIDIEGAEYLALKGGSRFLSELRPLILSEINPIPLNNVSEVSPIYYLNFIREFGYRAHRIEQGRIGREITDDEVMTLDHYINLVFVPK